MKRTDLKKLANAIQNCRNLKGAKFSYLLVKNLKIIQEEIEMFEQAAPQFEGKEKEYIQKLTHTKISCAKVDQDGKIQFDANGNIQIGDMEKFQEQVNSLNKEYLECLEPVTKAYKKYDKFLHEDVDIQFQKIDFSEVPQEISVGQLEGIEKLINDAG